MGYSAEGTRVYEAFKKNLEEHDMHFDPHDDDLTIRLTVQGDDLPQPTIIRVLDDRDVVQVISPIPFRMPEDKRIDAAIAVSIANLGMVNGSFDLNMNNGEIYFRIAQSYRETKLSEALVDYMLRVAYHTTDEYNDRFFMLGKSMITLEQFIEKENA